MKKKKQHIIPKCYLKAWCDPASPSNQMPYIWMISRDGTTKRNRSPEKSFRETDKYTIKLPHGARELIVEDTLAQIENAFVGVLRKIRDRRPLEANDRAHLCVFASAMFARSKAAGAHWAVQLGKLHEMVDRMEKVHGAEPSLSKQTRVFADHAQQAIIGMTLQTLPPLLLGMKLAILETDDPNGFITSDTPCTWFDPDAYKRPPLYRSPALAYPKVEITLPLAPQHLLLISHGKLEGYLRISARIVDELNRRTRFGCQEYFVSRKGIVKPYWFDSGKEPDDSWEKSEEGKRMLKERDKWAEIKAQWMADHASANGK